MVIESLNALSYAMVLFLLAAGMTLTFGVLRIANLTHGSYYLVGGYVGVSVAAASGNFLAALLAATLVGGCLGVLTERGLLARYVGNEPAQVLITFGLLFLLGDLSLWLWGPTPQTIPTPALLSGAVHIAGRIFPIYRLAVVIAGLVAAAGLWLAIERTRFGLAVRAAVDDRDLAQATGVNVRRLMTVVFTLGAALAGVAGVLNGPLIGVYPGADLDILLLSLVIVMIGGLGSLEGAFVGAILIGAISTFGSVFFPQLSLILIYLAMVITVAIRPSGLFGRRSV